MALQPLHETNMRKSCPVCGHEMEEERHVGVECFFDVQEIVPQTTKQPIFVEVDPVKTYWGTTRHYPAGTRDVHIVRDDITQNGLHVVKIDVDQEPSEPIRLLEKNMFNITCCKSCRADFLAIFGRWASGEFAQQSDEMLHTIRNTETASGKIEVLMREDHKTDDDK